MHALLQDLRYGVRMLWRKPGFTAITLLMLALGIGANTVVFSVVSAMLLRPLPYPKPERLVRLWESNPGRGLGESPASAPNFDDWRQQQTVCEQLAAYEFTTFNLTGSGSPERIAAVRVTASFLPALGVQPALGRNFLSSEEQAGGHHVAILSHGLWQRRFGSDPGLIGRQVQLSGESYTVVGVMPAYFQHTQGTELWVPLTLDPAVQPWRADRSNRNLQVIGRLHVSVSLAQAQAAMNAIAHRLEEQSPESNAGWGVRIRTFYDWIVPESHRRSMLVLFAAVGFVLLIACANVANLLLARASTRHREIAIRAALGASRARMIRQFLTESVLLSTLGGSAGVLLAFWGTEIIRTTTSISVPRLNEVRLDAGVLGFTAVLSVLSGLIFGLAPAWQASRIDLDDSLKEGGRSGSGAARQRLHSVLFVGEVALALVLLLGAGLMIRSLAHLQSVSLGFAPERVLMLQISLPESKYAERASRVAFFGQLLERLRGVPGVSDAAAVTQPPLGSGAGWAQEIVPEGAEAADPGTRMSAACFAVTPHYFQTMGIPLRQGRDFTEQDRGEFGGTPLTFIVNEAFARRFWPNVSAIGKRFRLGAGSPMGTVVGLVGNVRQASLEDEGGPAFYLSYGHIGMPGLTVVVRAVGSPEALTPALLSQVSSLDRDLPVYNVRSMEQLVSHAAGQPRFRAALMGAFSMAALLLAAFGIYGVVSYAVNQRTHEIGVRMALGAQARDVQTLILGQGVKLSLIGVGIGLGLALGLTRLLRGLLYQVSTTDFLTFVLASLLLGGVALLSCYLPARRATRVDPMVALRHE